MSDRNRKLTKASWAGWKIEFWKLLEKLAIKLSHLSTRKIVENTVKQDTLLSEIESAD